MAHWKYSHEYNQIFTYESNFGIDTQLDVLFDKANQLKSKRL